MHHEDDAISSKQLELMMDSIVKFCSGHSQSLRSEQVVALEA